MQGKYRVKIEKLPEDMGWQELKGLGTKFAQNGQCTFSRTNRDRTGVLEFTDRGDMDRAIGELETEDPREGCKPKGPAPDAKTAEAGDAGGGPVLPAEGEPGASRTAAPVRRRGSGPDLLRRRPLLFQGPVPSG